MMAAAPPGLVVVVTGAAGRVGQAVAAALVAARYTVRGLDVHQPANKAAAWVGAVDWRVCDLRDQAAAAAALASALAGAAALVHLAAVPDDADFLEHLLPVNIVGTHLVLEACKAAGPELKRVVVASSGKVMFGYGYGNGGSTAGLPLTAASPPQPVCLYGATKLFAEGAARALAVGSGKEVLAVRIAWCPRAPKDIEAMKACGSGQGIGADEYLSPNDAGRFFVCAVGATLPERFHSPVPYACLAACSKPPAGGVERFTNEAEELIGYTAVDSFPAGIEDILADNEAGYCETPGVKHAAADKQKTAVSQ
jgi:nucleoside-diphosphate-sugar epimerase